MLKGCKWMVTYLLFLYIYIYMVHVSRCMPDRVIMTRWSVVVIFDTCHVMLTFLPSALFLVMNATQPTDSANDRMTCRSHVVFLALPSIFTRPSQFQQAVLLYSLLIGRSTTILAKLAITLETTLEVEPTRQNPLESNVAIKIRRNLNHVSCG